jgi:myo-inositol-1(or 4)-monophosphatase
MKIDLKPVEQHVMELCHDVGEFIRVESMSFDRSRILQKEGFNNLVSYVDKEAEKKLVSTLSKLIPGSGILGEEGASVNSENGYLWIIDPLDGTTNFTHGLPPFAISIGLTLHDKAVLGIVYEVTKQEMFHAIEGHPAYCNDRLIRASTVSSMNESLFSTGFPYYEFPQIEAYLSIIRKFLRNSHGVRRLGSAATDLAYVAAGRFEGFFEYNLNPWDVAAGAFIVQQAGGIVTDFKGGDNFLYGREICAAGSSIHAEMQALIASEWGY